MNRHNVNVLIVDDEPSIRDSVSRVLENHGYAVAVACGGRDALEMIPVFKPDVLLLDIIMPGLNGYEVCRQARRSFPSVKIVYFTAKVDVVGFDGSARDVRHADAVIEKPASSEKIILCIDQVLRQQPARIGRPKI